MKLHTMAGILALAFGSTAAHAIDIDFDTGTLDQSIGNFYPGLTFGNASFASNFGVFGTTGPLGVYATVPGFYHWTAAEAITIGFATAASSVAIGVADLGESGFSMQAFDAAGILLADDTRFGVGQGRGRYDSFSVSAPGIASVRLFQVKPLIGNEGDGVLLDNLSYTVASVPEPSTYALLALGMGAIGLRVRRRKA